MSWRRSWSVPPLAALVAAVSILAGCGVGIDDEPRALEEEASATTAAEVPGVGSSSAALYFVRLGALVPVEQELPDRESATLVRALAVAPTDGATDGLNTSVPAGTSVLGTERNADLLSIDLSEDFDNVVGLSRQQAIGQMVLTVTERGSVERVAFKVEGTPLTVSSPERGDTTEVTACDFDNLLAAPDDLAGTNLDQDSLDLLAQRRESLGEQCADGAG